MAKVLVPEKLSSEGLTLLQRSTTVEERKGLSADELKRLIPEYEALVVRSETKVTEDLLKAGTKLKVVARAGVGTDNIGKSRRVFSCFAKREGLTISFTL